MEPSLSKVLWGERGRVAQAGRLLLHNTSGDTGDTWNQAHIPMVETCVRKEVTAFPPQVCVLGWA